MEKEAEMRQDVFAEGWGIMPRRILHDKEITSFAKLLYIEISSLCAAEGKCWAKNKYLAQRMGSSERTISAAISELKKYLTFTNRGTGNRLIMVQQPTTYERKKTKVENESDGGIINEVIELFRTVNPSVNMLFKRKNEREALERMIKQQGREKIEQIIKFLPRSNGHRYAPKITKPTELEEKFGKLIAWAESEKQGAKGKGKQIMI